MPNVRDEELGRRLFITNREKAAEEAVQKMQHALGHAWALFSSSEITALKGILGEVWVAVGRDEWGRFAFSRLTGRDIDALVAIGRNGVKNSRFEPREILQAEAILRATR